MAQFHPERVCESANDDTAKRQRERGRERAAEAVISQSVHGEDVMQRSSPGSPPKLPTYKHILYHSLHVMLPFIYVRKRKDDLQVRPLYLTRRHRVAIRDARLDFYSLKG